MRLTDRDLKLVKDLALSHLMSRDQIIELYFGSVTRANTRLRQLTKIGLVRRLETPFYSQSIYVPGRLAHEVAGERISKLIEHRAGSPRFVRHALQTTEVRIALTRKGSEWRFEQQLWRTFLFGKSFEVRPDGMLLSSIPVFVEVDLGHVSPAKVKEKVLGYQALAQSGLCQELYKTNQFRLLFATTGGLRSRRLRALVPNPGFELLCQTLEEIGARQIPNWS